MNTDSIDLSLTQSEPNSIWYTEKPVFCSKTGDQLFEAYEIKIPDGTSLGFYGKDVFYSKFFLKSVFLANEYVYIRLIVSSAKRVKRTSKNKRQNNKMAT